MSLRYCWSPVGPACHRLLANQWFLNRSGPRKVLGAWSLLVLGVANNPTLEYHLDAPHGAYLGCFDTAQLSVDVSKVWASVLGQTLLQHQDDNQAMAKAGNPATDGEPLLHRAATAMVPFASCCVGTFLLQSVSCSNSTGLT
eukprot:GHUV01026231.1.p1 GENE.GHUV01026231.1~~GHUV01026231.1.p1  ORF type:complete len:142 (+),score=25.65 GHUV01026231.1:420-845(+)